MVPGDRGGNSTGTVQSGWLIGVMPAKSVTSSSVAQVRSAVKGSPESQCVPSARLSPSHTIAAIVSSTAIQYGGRIRQQRRIVKRRRSPSQCRPSR